MYCSNLNEYLNILVRDGAVKLPSVKDASWRDAIFKNCIKEIGTKSYGENLPANLRFLDYSNIISSLLPALLDLADAEFNVRPNTADVYNVCRLVRPGDTSEGFRGHFDSHLFTLVTPINIPDFEDVTLAGQLHYFPKSRNQPFSEIRNVIEKAYFKKYNSAAGFDKLAQNKNRIIDDFNDYRPLLFLGNTTFHGNAPVQASCNESRMTILTHFFDPSPRYGIGAIMRHLRSR